MHANKLALATAVAALLVGGASPARAQATGTIGRPAPSVTAPAAVQPPDSTADEARIVHRPRLGPLIGGAVTFGVSWGVALFGGLLIATEIECHTCASEGEALMIPLAGPLLLESKAHARGEGAGWTVSAAWSLVQVTGAVLLVVGLLGHDVPAPRAAPLRGPTVSLVPGFARHASTLALNVTW